jgi:hypothetical protein
MFLRTRQYLKVVKAQKKGTPREYTFMLLADQTLLGLLALCAFKSPWGFGALCGYIAITEVIYRRYLDLGRA